jgi:hypothetical protein
MKKITICAKKAIDYLKTFRLSNITVKFPIINLSFAPSIFSAAFGRKLLFYPFLARSNLSIRSSCGEISP